jgi:hypothetical protein
LDGDGLAAGVGDRLDRRLGLVLVAGVVDDDRKAVFRQPLCSLAADAARPAGNDC